MIYTAGRNVPDGFADAADAVIAQVAKENEGSDHGDIR